MLILSVCCVAYIEYFILTLFLNILTEWTREINRMFMHLDNQKYLFRCVLVFTVVFYSLKWIILESFRPLLVSQYKDLGAKLG